MPRASQPLGTQLGRYLELSQVPDFEGPIIPTAEQEGLPAAPADDIDIPIMGSGRGEHAGLAWGCSDVPDANGGISGAGGKHLRGSNRFELERCPNPQTAPSFIVSLSDQGPVWVPFPPKPGFRFLACPHPHQTYMSRSPAFPHRVLSW